MSEGWRNGSTRAWREIRKQILERDQRRCRLKLPGCTIIATHVHHTLGQSVTGNDPRHLIAACEHCNLKTGDPTKHDPKPRSRRQW